MSLYLPQHHLIQPSIHPSIRPVDPIPLGRITKGMSTDYVHRDSFTIVGAPYYGRSSLLPPPILHFSITRAAHYSSSPEIHRPGWKVAKERQPQTVNNSAFPHSITIPNHDYRRPATRDRRMVQFSACNDELLHRLIISIGNDHPNRTDRTRNDDY